MESIRNKIKISPVDIDIYIYLFSMCGSPRQFHGSIIDIVDNIRHSCDYRRRQN